MTDRPWSLRWRLIVGLSIVLTLGTVIPILAVIIESTHLIDTMLDRTIQDQASDIVRALDLKTKTLSVPEGLARSYRQSNDEFLYAVFEKNGRLIGASSSRAEQVLRRAAEPSSDKFSALHPVDGGGPWYSYSTAVGDFKVVVAQSGLHEDVLADSVIGEFARESPPVLLGVMLVGILVVWITLRHAFKAIDRAALVASRMQPGKGVPPLASRGMPMEIRPFVDAVASAMQRLESALDAERRFIANAAHEIRTPLSILTARIDGLPVGVVRLALAKDVDRINRLVAQLLEVARLEANTLKLDAEFDLREVVFRTVAELAPLAVKEGREIAIVGDARSMRVRADPHALALALRNLIENAMKHTPRGSGIEVTLAPPADIEVRDRGPGIPEPEHDRLFRRFQRGATAASGAGLGLSIVGEILRLHGGTVRIENRTDGGAAFVLSLPAERALSSQRSA